MASVGRNFVICLVAMVVTVANGKILSDTLLNELAKNYEASTKVLESKVAKQTDVLLTEPAKHHMEENTCKGNSRCPLPADCEEQLTLGNNVSGVYRIWPRNKIMNGMSIQVYCDMDTDGGGWTVLQRRGNFSRPLEFFHKDWASYKKGFGNVQKDFWLGNDNIFAISNQKQYNVRFDMASVDGNESYAVYERFYIEDESENYTLTIDDYYGLAGDSMKYHSGWQFTTIDQDNDGLDGHNCAQLFGGGWWFNNFCYAANLNGLDLKGPIEYPNGIVWSTFRGYYESLAKADIKIRSQQFAPHKRR